MKKIVGIGDIHIKSSYYYKVGFEGFLKFIDETFSDSKADETEFVVAGDVFDRLSIIPSDAAKAERLFRLLKRKSIAVYAILGNHDYGVVKTEQKSCRPFLEELGVVVIKDFKSITTTLGFKMACIPWVPDVGMKAFDEKVAELAGNYDVVVSHWQTAPTWFEKSFYDISCCKAKAQFCGHIHSRKEGEMYLGSILPNEKSDDKSKSPAVLKILMEGESAPHVMNLPEFVHIENLSPKTVEEIQQYDIRPNLFYALTFEAGPKTAPMIEVANQVLGKQLYSTTIASKPETLLLKEAASITVKPKKEMLADYYKAHGLAEDSVFQFCTEAIEAVH